MCKQKNVTVEYDNFNTKLSLMSKILKLYILKFEFLNYVTLKKLINFNNNVLRNFYQELEVRRSKNSGLSNKITDNVNI